MIGMLFTIGCIFMIAYPDEDSPYSSKLILKNIEWHSDYATALLYGFLTPLLIGLQLVSSKYWTNNYGYDSM